MSTRLAQYKKTGGSVQSRRELRKDDKAKETRAKRNEKFMNRRTLSEVNNPQVDTRSKEAMKQPKDKRSNDRMEELVKWRKKKEEKKAVEKKSKEKDRPPFVVGKYSKPNNKIAENKQQKKERKVQTKQPKVPKVKANEEEGASRTLEPDSLTTPPVPQPPPSRIGYQYKVNHPAWIPGATVSSPVNVQGFDETFAKAFSPFKFTGATKGKSSSDLFTSHKAVAASPSSVANELLEDSLESYDKEANQYTHCNRSDDSVELINHSILHNHQMTNTINNSEGEEQVDDQEPETPIQEDLTSGAGAQDSEPSVYAPFRQLHDDVVEKFTTLSNQWEAKEAELQRTHQASEDVYDQIRTTVCQARLLMRSKLKQYVGLVDKAEDPTQPLPTTAEDLQGFWDMVFFQVSDIEEKFKSLSSLESANWEKTTQDISQTVPAKRVSKKRRSTGKGAKSRTPSDKLKADRAKRAEQRQKLKEKMMAAKKLKKRRSSDCFVPAAGSGLTPPQVSSCRVEGDSSGTADVPTGDLLAITPNKTPPSSRSLRRKSHTLARPHVTSSSSSESESGLVTKLVRINATKRLIQEMGSDVIMSPARRSMRLHRKSVGVASDTGYMVDSMDELPEDVKCVYRPNKSITDCSY